MLKVIQFQAFLKRKMFTQEDILYFRVLINSELIHQRIFTKAQKEKNYKSKNMMILLKAQIMILKNIK